MSGVGNAIVVPATDDSGIVRIIVTDGSGDPADETLCEKVYNYIMKPDDPYNRLAPINAQLSVTPPAIIYLNVAAVLEIRDTSIEDVKTAFTNAMRAYFPTAITDGEIRYQKVANILGDVEGVYDFTGLTINDGTSNVHIDAYEAPYIQTLNFTEEE